MDCVWWILHSSILILMLLSPFICFIFFLDEKKRRRRRFAVCENTLVLCVCFYLSRDLCFFFLQFRSNLFKCAHMYECVCVYHDATYQLASNNPGLSYYLRKKLEWIVSKAELVVFTLWFFFSCLLETPLFWNFFTKTFFLCFFLFPHLEIE